MLLLTLRLGLWWFARGQLLLFPNGLYSPVFGEAEYVAAVANGATVLPGAQG